MPRSAQFRKLLYAVAVLGAGRSLRMILGLASFGRIISGNYARSGLTWAAHICPYSTNEYGRSLEIYL